MVLRLAQKKNIVLQLNQIASTAVSSAVVGYSGLNASEMTRLRSEARQSGIYVRVYRNTLARLALRNTVFSCLEPALGGPVVLLFSHQELGSIARLLSCFIKNCEKLEIKAFSLGDGTLLGPERMEHIASLPSQKEALSQLMGAIKAPITALVRTVQEPVTQTVRVLNQIAHR